MKFQPGDRVKAGRNAGTVKYFDGEFYQTKMDDPVINDRRTGTAGWYGASLTLIPEEKPERKPVVGDRVRASVKNVECVVDYVHSDGKVLVVDASGDYLLGEITEYLDPPKPVMVPDKLYADAHGDLYKVARGGQVTKTYLSHDYAGRNLYSSVEEALRICSPKGLHEVKITAV